MLTMAACVLAFAIAVDAAPAKKPPHLFFMLVDDLGFNDFSYRSSDLKDVAWPHVNALLNESVKIDTYYTQPLCTPTRAAFMTGRYPARLGLQHGVIAGFQDYGLPLDEVTLAGVKPDGTNIFELEIQALQRLVRELEEKMDEMEVRIEQEKEAAREVVEDLVEEEICHGLVYQVASKAIIIAQTEFVAEQVI